MKKFKKDVCCLILLLSTFFTIPARFISYDYRKSISTELQQKINKIVKEAMEKYDIPGAIIGIWSASDGMWVKAFGKSDVFEGKDMKGGYKVRIGSITKTFVATVLLQLVDERKIHLDDTLINYIPGIPNADKITIRQLANHTSGIFDYADDKNFWPKVFADPLKQWAPQELLNIALSHPSYFAPGGGWHYSNTNYILLGMIIEQVTGNKLENETKRRLIEPLELKKTNFATESFMIGEYSHGYMDRNGDGKFEDITLLDPSVGWAAGAMISNLEDLAIWAKALVKEKLSSAKIRNEHFRWVDTGQPHLRYGIGVAKLGNFIGHDGAIPGYNSAMFYLPSEDITIIVLLNNFADTNVATLLFMEIAKILTPAEAPWRFDKK